MIVVRLLFAFLGLLAFAQSSYAAGDTFEARGLLVPYEQARLASRAQGVIESIRREGEAVKKGDVVMALESRMEELQLAQQKHILDLRAFEHRASDELNSKSVISKNEVEEKRVNHEVSKVQFSQAEHLLDKRRVIAPFDGAVAERLREAGEAVDEFVPVLLLVNLSNLYLEAFLPGELIGKVSPGDPVEVRAGEGIVVRGQVAQIAPTVNPASGEFKVRVLVPNADGRLISGTYAAATFGKPPADTVSKP